MRLKCRAHAVITSTGSEIAARNARGATRIVPSAGCQSTHTLRTLLLRIRFRALSVLVLLDLAQAVSPVLVTGRGLAMSDGRALELADRLWGYAGHLDTCDRLRHRYGECSCGFSALNTELHSLLEEASREQAKDE